jgi:hypothetical protein
LANGPAIISAGKQLSGAELSAATGLAKQYAVLGAGENVAISTEGWPNNLSCAQIVATTHGAAAMQLDGSVPPDANRRVVVIQLCGTFSIEMPHPPGASTASSKYITIVMDPSSGTLMDLAVGDSATRLDTFGSQVVDVLNRP